MTISLPVLVGLGSLLAVSPVLLKMLGRPSRKPKKNDDKESGGKEYYFPSSTVPEKVVDVVADSVKTQNKINYAVIGVICAFLMAVIKVNSDD